MHIADKVLELGLIEDAYAIHIDLFELESKLA